MRHRPFSRFTAVCAVWLCQRFLRSFVPPSAVTRRQSLIGAGAVLLVTNSANSAANSAETCEACCLKDWCACDHRICDCHAILEANGFQVPPEVSELGTDGGRQPRTRWSSAQLPRFSPVSREDIMVRNSTLKGAGQGELLPKDLWILVFWMEMKHMKGRSCSAR